MKSGQADWIAGAGGIRTGGDEGSEQLIADGHFRHFLLPRCLDFVAGVTSKEITFSSHSQYLYVFSMSNS
jgi:hypothetical protein